MKVYQNFSIFLSLFFLFSFSGLAAGPELDPSCDENTFTGLKAKQECLLGPSSTQACALMTAIVGLGAAPAGKYVGQLVGSLVKKMPTSSSRNFLSALDELKTHSQAFQIAKDADTASIQKVFKGKYRDRSHFDVSPKTDGPDLENLKKEAEAEYKKSIDSAINSTKDPVLKSYLTDLRSPDESATHVKLRQRLQL